MTKKRCKILTLAIPQKLCRSEAFPFFRKNIPSPMVESFMGPTGHTMDCLVLIKYRWRGVEGFWPSSQILADVLTPNQGGGDRLCPPHQYSPGPLWIFRPSYIPVVNRTQVAQRRIMRQTMIMNLAQSGCGNICSPTLFYPNSKPIEI